MTTNIDMVHEPRHYQADRFGCECIAIGRHLIGTAFNAWKYTWRHAEKNGAEDLRKALVYLDWAEEDQVAAILPGHEAVVWSLHREHIEPQLAENDPVYGALTAILYSNWPAAREIITKRLEELS